MFDLLHEDSNNMLKHQLWIKKRRNQMQITSAKHSTLLMNAFSWTKYLVIIHTTSILTASLLFSSARIYIDWLVSLAFSADYWFPIITLRFHPPPLHHNQFFIFEHLAWFFLLGMFISIIAIDFIMFWQKITHYVYNFILPLFSFVTVNV